MSQSSSALESPVSPIIESNNQKSPDSSQQSLPKDASVYVSELDQSVTEADLFPIFSSYGDILSIRVVRDPTSRRSLGYAYVNFKSTDDASAALQHDFNYINNKPCRVSPFEKDPSLRHTSPKSTVFVRNLDVDISLDELKSAFESFGTIVGAKIAPPLVGDRSNAKTSSASSPSPKDSQGSPTLDEKSDDSEQLEKNDASSGAHTFGYVEFETSEQADSAIQELNGATLGKRTIYTNRHISKRSNAERNFVKIPSVSETEANFTNLFVKNIDPSVTADEFENLFAKYGPIVAHSLPKDADGNVRGFGFVNFQEHADALEALKALNDSPFKDKTLIVTRAMKKHERDEELRQQYEASRFKRMVKFSGNNLYIKHLDLSIDDEKLEELFAPFGVITSARVMTDDNGKSRGFGFVCYSTIAEAQMAISEMHNKEHSGNTLYVTIANRKDTRPYFVPPFPFFNGSVPQNFVEGQNGPGGPAHNHHNNSNGRNGRSPPYGNPLFSPYYHLAAAAAAGANGISPNYGGAQPWGPPPHVGGASNGPPGAPPPVIFAPGPPYPYPGMIPVPSNMNFRKHGPNGNNGRNLNGHVKSYGSHQQGPRGSRKQNSNNVSSSPNRNYHGNSPNGHHGNHSNRHGGPRQSNNGFNNRHNGQTNTSNNNVSSPNPNTNSNNANTNTDNSNNNYFPSSTLGAALASAANPAAERQVIGEALYPKVQRHPAVRNNAELTAKLTGMMLDINTQELLKWIDNDAVLNSRVQQAYDQYMEFLSNKDKDIGEDESDKKNEDDI